MLGFQIFWTARRTLAGGEAMAMLAKEPAARDFVADAFAHLKIIGHNAAATPLLGKAGIAEEVDEGFITLGDDKDVDRFVTACRMLRFWKRGELTERM